MNLLERLKNRLLLRKNDAQTGYWAALSKTASTDTLSERAMVALLETVEGAMVALGKNTEQVEQDLEHLRELRTIEAALSARQLAVEHVHEVARAGLAVEQEATKLEQQARTLRREHEASLHAARARQRVTDGAAAQLAELRQRLAAAGHPEHVAEVEASEIARQVESLEGELRGFEGELREVEVAAESPPFDPRPNDPSSPRVNARAIGRRDDLRRKRAAIVARIAALRGGAPIAEVEVQAEDGSVEVMP